jgi:hypothetical protein
MIFRLVLPELARMLRQIQPIVEEASDIVSSAVEHGSITVPAEYGAPATAVPTRSGDGDGEGEGEGEGEG